MRKSQRQSSICGRVLSAVDRVFDQLARDIRLITFGAVPVARPIHRKRAVSHRVAKDARV